MKITNEMQKYLRIIVLSDDEEKFHLEKSRRQVLEKLLETITECWCEIHRIDVKLKKLMENGGGSCEG